jgi:hypothetical protein
MKILEDLLTSWIGLLSLFTIVFIIGMAGFLIVFFTKHMKEPGE